LERVKGAFQVWKGLKYRMKVPLKQEFLVLVLVLALVPAVLIRPYHCNNIISVKLGCHKDLLCFVGLCFSVFV
jgi:hypothetical protein